VLAQTKADSLELSFQTATADASKINILHKLFYEYRYADPLRAKNAILKAIQLAEKNNYPQLNIESNLILGDFLQIQSSPDSAIVIFKHSLQLSNEIGDIEGQCNSLFGIGSSYWRKNDFETARNYQILLSQLAEKNNNYYGKAKSLKLEGDIYTETGEYGNAMKSYVSASDVFKKIGKIEDYGKSINNIGFVYRRLGNYESATKYFLQSDSIYRLNNDRVGMASVQHNLAVIHKNQGRLEQAFLYNLRAIALFKELTDRKRLGYTYYTMGEIYRLQKQPKRALDYFWQAITCSTKVGDSVNVGYTYIAIGDTNEQENNHEKAKSAWLQAVEIALSMDQYLMAMDAQDRLSALYAKERNYYKAYESKKEYAAIRDSFYTIEKRDFAASIEAKYQNEEKLKENALLAKDNDLKALKLKQRVNERNVIIAFAIISLILGLLVYSQYRIKRNANEKLRELDRLKSNFFANISHEFRTPLTLIKGPIEHLEQNPEERLSPENVKMIRRNANRLLKLVNQLLDLSKSDEGSLQLEPTEGDLFKCLRAVTSSFNSLAAQRHIDYRVSIPQTAFWTSFDRDKIEKVVYNLLSNAFKFSEDTSVITCEVKHLNGTLFIEVSDSGKGIPKERLPMIFDRFYQVDSTYNRDGEGSGIGLSIAKEFVNLMDGTITVSSEINKGTYFTVQLPLQEIKTGETKTEKEIDITVEPQPKKTFALTKEDKRDLPGILLIEDNKDMRHFIREQLIKHYRFREAINGESGLSEAISNPPDLIITDLMMPKMDGIELCKKLKTNITTSHIPVIMLTAKAGMENKIEGLETGADDYLTKPFHAEELLVRTKNLIAQRKQLRELFANRELRIDPKSITVTSLDQKFLEDVLKLLELKFSEAEFGVPQLQTELAMSKTQLHRKLKALTNEAPGELLRNFRLKRAAQLLLQDADNVTQVAYSVGFNNLSYFAKCFKELYGVSPSAYSQSLPN
jgi:signal transduction histidine kinase/DNA-binding response OmpR family regulator